MALRQRHTIQILTVNKSVMVNMQICGVVVKIVTTRSPDFMYGKDLQKYAHFVNVRAFPIK